MTESAAAAAADITIEQIDVTLIDVNPWNPNRQSDLIRRATRESLEEFGFVEPVLLRPHPDVPGRYQMVNGEHRFEQSIDLGHVTVPAVVRDLTDEQAKKLTIVLNETTGEADVVLLGQLLADIEQMDNFRVALPYTDAEIEHLLSLGSTDWTTYLNEPPAPPVEPGEDDVHEVVLHLTAGQHDQFRTWVQILEREWSVTGGVTEAVVEAVRRAALAANSGA